jgi:plastocyanin
MSSPVAPMMNGALEQMGAIKETIVNQYITKVLHSNVITSFQNIFMPTYFETGKNYLSVLFIRIISICFLFFILFARPVSAAATNAYNFDGGDYVSMSNIVADLNGQSVMTISLWAKFTDTSTAHCLFGHTGGKLYFCFDGDGTIGAAGKLIAGQNSGAHANISTNTVTLNDNTWYHLVVVYSASDWTIYVNGVSEPLDKLPYAVTLNGLGSGDFYVGYSPSLGNKFFDGVMDDFQVYNTALDQTAVTNLYGGGDPTEISASATGLIAYWKMNGTGTTGVSSVIDSQTTGDNTGQLGANTTSGVDDPTTGATGIASVTDAIAPNISSISIVNSDHKVGDIVNATITVTSDTDDYTTGSGAITGTINGYTLGSLSKTNNTTYTATFSVIDGGTDVAAGTNIAVSFTIDDSSGNTSAAFSTAIIQASDAIYANLPDVDLTANTNTIAEDGGVSTLTATLNSSLNNQWPTGITVNLAYTGTGTAGMDYTKSDSIVISSGNSSNTSTLTGTADTVFDAAAAETAIVDISSISVGNEGTTNQQTITITDAETAPTVTLSVGSASIAENGGTSSITATLSHETYDNAVVNFSYSGTATGGGTDYNTPSSSITINAGSLTANTVSGITAVDDGSSDGNLIIVIDISSVTGSASENGTQQKTVTIIEDDNTAPALTNLLTAYTVIEDVASAINLSAATFSDTEGDSLTVTLAVNGGTIASIDGNAVTGNVTITNSGTSSMTIAGSIADIHTYLDTVNKIEVTTATNSLTDITLTLTPNDGELSGASVTSTLSVTPVNDAPTVSIGANQTVGGVGIGGVTQTVNTFASSFNDGDDGTQAISNFVISEASDVNNVVSAVDINNAGNLTYTPASNVEGVATINIQVQDDGLTANSGVDTSPIQTFTITVDTLAPVAPSTPDLATGADSGDSDSDNITSDITPTLSGTAESGTTIKLYSDQEGGGSTLLTSGTATGGTWDLTTSALTANVTHSITATATDTLGNVGAASSGLSIAIDTTPPTLQILSPADNATGLSSSANISMDFDENIALGAGNITINHSSDNSTVATINVAAHGGQLSITNDTLTVNPSANLADNTEYYVLMDATVIDDISGNSFTGISTATDWSFTTADISPPTVTGVTVKGSPNDIDTSMQFTVAFDENANAITTSDFTVTTVSGDATGDVTAVSASSGTSVDVTVSNISGAGSIRLDLNTGTNIIDDDANGNNNNGYVSTYTSGASHNVDRTAPVISAIVIPNSPHKVGDVVTATITVSTDTDTYILGASTVGGYTLASFGKTDDTTYTATFTITDGGADVDAGADIPVSLILSDASGNSNAAFTTAISQVSDAIYANLPDFTLSAADGILGESGDTEIITASITGSLNNKWPVNLSVPLSFADTNNSGINNDYSVSGSSITITAGLSSGLITATGIDDAIFDAPSNESFVVSIGSLSIGNDNGGDPTIIITDDEVTPVVTLQVSDNTINEDGGMASITATLNNATYENVTVNLSYTGAATSAGTDYNTPSTNITITGGATSGDAVTGITSVNDSVEEGDETIIIDVSTISDGSAVEDGAQQQTITITDDDDTTPPVFDSTPVLSTITDAGATLAVDIDEQGDVYYIVVDQADTAPTATQTKAAINYAGATVHASGTIATTSTTGTANIVGLSDAVNYTVYVVAQDTNTNLQADGSMVALNLTTLDTLPNVASITLSGTPAQTASTITYNMVFSDDVINVDITDLTLTLVSGATHVVPVINTVSGSGTSYTVTITTGVTVGDIRLDLNAGTDIVDESNNIPAGYITGEVHSVNTNLSPTIIEATNSVGPFDIDEDVKTSLDLSDVFTADDNGNEITVTLSSDNGLLFAKDGNSTVSSTTIAGSSVTGTSSITLTGQGNDINTFLDDVTRILFQTTLNNTDVSTLTITSNDWFEAGTGLSKTITINAINDAPAISGVPTTSVVDGNAYSFTPTASDIENETLSFTITNQPTWASFDTATGELSGNPTPAHVGTTSGIVIRVIDSNGAGNDLASFNVEVTASNAAPVITQGTNTTVVMSEDGSPTAFSLTLGATDANSDLLTWIISSQATNGSATVSGTGNSQAISYTPNNHYFGADSFVVNVSDGLVNDTITVNVTVSSVNDLPNFTSTGVTAGTQDINYNYNIIASDSDDSSLTITATTKPTWLTVADNGNGTATLSGLPTNANIGNNSVVLIVVDNENGTAIQSFTVVVSDTNDAPVITGIPGTAVAQDVVYSFTPSVSDVDAGDTQTFSLTNKPSWAAFSTTTGTLTGTPADDDVGVTVGIVITVTDSAGATASLTAFSVTVSNTNDAPVITGTPTITVAQDVVYSFTPSVSDVDAGDTQTFSITNKPSWTAFSATTGALIGTPTNDDVGVTADIVITVTDSAGDTASLTAFSVTVSNTNEAPVITGTPTITVAQDVVYSFTPSVSDVDAGDIQTFSITNKPSWAAFSATTGALTGTPANDDVGVTVGIVITVTDSAGATASLTAFNVTVSNTNDAPVITGKPATTVVQDVAYSFTPSVSDVDAGDTQTFSITNKPSWTAFSTTTGALIGTPTNDDVGVTAGIVITVTDSAGDTASLTAFSVTVSNTNDAPVIKGKPATRVVQDVAYSFTPSVTDAGDTHTFSINNKPSWAAFSTTTGALTGTPSKSDIGTTSGIIISVTDSGNASANLTAFNLEVVEINQAPVAAEVSQTLAEDSDTSVILSATDNNEGDEFTFIIASEPLHGSLTASSNNTAKWQYTPEADYYGEDSFTYMANDGDADSAPATVSLTITSVNDAPVATDDDITLASNEAGVYVIDVLSNDSDIENDELNITNASASIGSVSIDNNQLVYQTQAGVQGVISLDYVINDGHPTQDNGSAQARVTLFIDGGINVQLPIITLPEDIIVNATGLFTKVDLGVATAVDNAGQILPVSLVDGSTLFRPGNNIAYWQAEDIQGLKSVASQSVVVHPLISMSRDKTSVEGTSHDVFIYLNGAAPIYPVTIGYSVSGSADANDHNLISGDIVIDSGEVGSISFDVLADEMAEESETLTITLDDTLNLGAKSAYTLTITEQNIAPQVNYSVTQDNEQRLLIENNAGQVVIQTQVSDSNTLDTHQYQWLDSDSELVDVDNDETTYTFETTGLKDGIQTLNLVVTDNGDTPLSTTANIYLVITEVLVVLTDVDSDGDLIPDNEEGLGDDDFDGIPNYLDVPSACNVMPQQVVESQVFLVEGESGVCLRKGATVANNKSGGLELAPDEVQNDEDTLNVGGIFDFIAYGLSEAGQSYNLVLPQRLPIPANALYRKLTPVNGWVDFVVDVNNQFASSQGSFGFCPPPGDASWTIGLNEGHWCVQLTIEDGGPNDDDGLANGSIDDPGGVAVLISTNHFPVAEAETTSTAQNTPITIDVLLNDSDEDNDTLTIDSASADFGVVYIDSNIQQLIYTPAISFIGAATINYGVSDGNGGTSFANVTVNVTVIENQAPVTQNDSASTDDRTAIIIAPLANDSDGNNDTLTLISADAQQGNVTIGTDNTLTYTPKKGFDGEDNITYTIDDGKGSQATGQITVTVIAYEIITVTNTSRGGGAMAWWFIGIVSLLAYRRKMARVNSRAASQERLKNQGAGS